MVSGTDLEVLKALADLGGKAHVSVIAAKAGLRTPYAEMLCNGLGRHDYIDMFASGTCHLTAKGWQALRANGWRSADGEQGEGTGQASGLIGADRLLDAWRSKLERGEITREEYQQKRTEIIVRMARGVE